MTQTTKIRIVFIVITLAIILIKGAIVFNNYIERKAVEKEVEVFFNNLEY